MIYMRNRKSQEIHRLDDDSRSLEECNLDQARDSGALEVIDETDALHIVAENKELACGHCWPKDESNVNNS